MNALVDGVDEVDGFLSPPHAYTCARAPSLPDFYGKRENSECVWMGIENHRLHRLHRPQAPRLKASAQ